jgi:hypothetical protein
LEELITSTDVVEEMTTDNGDEEMTNTNVVEEITKH